MKTVLIIDRETRLARSLQNLAGILGIPVELAARKNIVRQVYSSGTVGLMIANTELTTVRFTDLLTDLDAIRRRNRIPKVPCYYIFTPPIENVENLPEDVPSPALLSRDTSLAAIYGLLEKHILSEPEADRESSFTRYSKLHESFIEAFGTWLGEFGDVIERVEAKDAH